LSVGPKINQPKNYKIDRLESRVEKLQSLIEVSIIINSTLDLDDLIELVLDKAESVMSAEASSVMLVNEDGNRLLCEVARGEVGAKVRESIQLEKGQGVAGWVWQNGEPLIVPDVSADKRFFSGIDSQSGFVTRSILAAPLKIQERIIGVAEVLNPKDGSRFTEDDLELFSTFCRLVALAIDNARLHKLRIEQERMQQQLESARVIQQSFMPQELPQCPQGRYRIAAKNLPAIAVGGDLYDALVFDDQYVGVLVGDVSGKGIPAALFMARLVSDFHFHANQMLDPGLLLTTLNNALVERSRQGMFVTLQYLLLDANTGKVLIADGGHLPPIVVQRGGARVYPLDVSGGCPLGILRSSEFPVSEFYLNAGDTLILYTDGVIEAKNATGEQFSLQRLMKLVTQDKSVNEILDATMSSLLDFSRNVEQHDDITILALSWRDEKK